MNPDSGLTMAARGLEPADLNLNNAKIINVFTCEIEQGNIAIYKWRVAGNGDYRQAGRTAGLKGTYALLGLIDRHVHIESSMVDSEQYARTVACGTKNTDILLAIQAINIQHGRLAVTVDGSVLGALAFPVEGLLSTDIRNRLLPVCELEDMVRLHITVTIRYSVFLALPVIPELRLTDMGLVDDELKIRKPG